MTAQELNLRAQPGERRIFASAQDWNKIRIYVKQFQKQNPELLFKTTGGIDFDGEDGVMIEAENRPSYEKLAKYLKIQDKAPEPKREPAVGTPENPYVTLGPDTNAINLPFTRRKEQGEVPGTTGYKYPWQSLVEVGDHFVTQTPIRGMAPLVSRENSIRQRVDGSIIRSHSTPDGTIVIVVYSGNKR